MNFLNWVINKLNPPISFAKEMSDKGKADPMKYPHLSLLDSEPMSVNLKIEVPKFATRLAAKDNILVEKYLEKFLVLCLYLEQGMRVESQPINNNSKGKQQVTTRLNPKNPLMN